ncbi:hypothetical protein [Mycobacterium sp. 050134]|uniref:hypothetical protein n=1 Tax=Mycobacterium sp. 050134 TaxID=3096111 RepID=UPI002EDB188A
MGDGDEVVGYEAAQALELIRALHDQLREMAAQLGRVERQHRAGLTGGAGALRAEAMSLRRDMREAQFHIDRLRRCYLSDGRPHAAS